MEDNGLQFKEYAGKENTYILTISKNLKGGEEEGFLDYTNEFFKDKSKIEILAVDIEISPFGIDSRGFGKLLGLIQKVKNLGGETRFSNIGEKFERLLETRCGGYNLFKVYPSLDEALKY